jgi:hypothetical protein
MDDGASGSLLWCQRHQNRAPGCQCGKGNTPQLRNAIDLQQQLIRPAHPRRSPCRQNQNQDRRIAHASPLASSNTTQGGLPGPTVAKTSTLAIRRASAYIGSNSCFRVQT